MGWGSNLQAMSDRLRHLRLCRRALAADSDPPAAARPAQPQPAAASGPARGKGLLRTAFMLSDEDVLLNHGSYGATPRMVVQRQQELVAQLELNPDTWFRYDYKPLWDEATEAIGAMVGCEGQDVAFVKNATAGVNAVTRQLELGAGDACLIADQTCGLSPLRPACGQPWRLTRRVGRRWGLRQRCARRVRQVRRGVHRP